MIKKIDNLGRVVVPKGYRLMLGLKPGDQLEVEVDDGKLLMSPRLDGCTFCGAESVAGSHLGKNICVGCLESIRELPAT
jgi:AbrB family looped-hinge helix DNA binding protein